MTVHLSPSLVRYNSNFQFQAHQLSNDEKAETVTDVFTAKLAELDFQFSNQCQPPSEALVSSFEKRFSVQLPADYRLFLLQHGGVMGFAVSPFLEPTPCGTATVVCCFFGFADKYYDIGKNTALIEGAPDVVAIGDNSMGAMFWLKCTGWDAGSVYMHDGEGRSAWPDDVFLARFPSLDDEIKNYLQLRQEGKLPQKHKGYDHVYCVGKSFTQFFNNLRAD